MKKKYSKPSIISVKFFNTLSLCKTSEIDVGGKTNSFDARRKRKWKDEEDEEEEW